MLVIKMNKKRNLKVDKLKQVKRDRKIFHFIKNKTVSKSK